MPSERINQDSLGDTLKSIHPSRVRSILPPYQLHQCQTSYNNIWVDLMDKVCNNYPYNYLMTVLDSAYKIKPLRLQYHLLGLLTHLLTTRSILGTRWSLVVGRWILFVKIFGWLVNNWKLLTIIATNRVIMKLPGCIVIAILCEVFKLHPLVPLFIFSTSFSAAKENGSWVSYSWYQLHPDMANQA